MSRSLQWDLRKRRELFLEGGWDPGGRQVEGCDTTGRTDKIVFTEQRLAWGGPTRLPVFES